MADDVAIFRMDPAAGFIVGGDAREEEYFVTCVEPRDVRSALAENGAVHGSAETRRPLRRKRWWCTMFHGPNLDATFRAAKQPEITYARVHLGPHVDHSLE